MEGKDKRIERLIKYARIPITISEPPLMALQVSSAELWIHLHLMPQAFHSPNLQKPPNFVFLLNAARNVRGLPPQTCFPRRPPARRPGRPGTARPSRAATGGYARTGCDRPVTRERLPSSAGRGTPLNERPQLQLTVLQPAPLPGATPPPLPRPRLSRTTRPRCRPTPRAR